MLGRSRTSFSSLFAALVIGGMAQAQTTPFVGMVTDSAKRPIADAEVTVTDIGRATRTAADGTFRIDNVPLGDHPISVRRLGYEAVDVTLSFTEHRVGRLIQMRKVVQLDSVVVTDVSSGIPSFDDNRKVGLGHFLTRADLQKFGDLKLQDAIAGFAAAKIARGRSDAAWLTTSRVRSLRPDCDKGDDGDRRILKANPCLCYAQIYLDDVAIYNGRPGEPLVDLNAYPLDQVEGVEFYAGPSETPLKYSRLNSVCGVLVIWTRMARKSDKPPALD